MRARNIKPSLFKNEVLGTADPLLTILFEGLWCEADRNGRLEDRPLRLKAEILPYRNDANIDAMLDWLCANEFISRYQAAGAKVIQVLKFSDHQRPHANEAESVLPSMEASKHNQGKKSVQPRKQALRSDSGSLIPDSGSLIPDCTIRASDPKPEEVPRGADEDQIHLHVLAIKAKYPKAAREDWIAAEKAMRNIVLRGEASWFELEAVVERYAKYCRSTNRIVQNPGNWFQAPDRPWLTQWELPKTKAENRLASNVDVMQQFVGGERASG